MGEITATELAGVTSFPKLVDLLRNKLEWPIGEHYGFDDVVYEYDGKDLGLKESEIAKIREIHQLRPLVTNQPWGVFFISLEDKAISVTVLRRMLRALVVGKRAGAQSAERQAWDKHDLIFAACFGKSGERELAFVHFCDGARTNDLPVMKVLGWNAKDTKLHNEHVGKMLLEQLTWPDDPEDQEAWRESWSSTFETGLNEVIRTSRDLAIRLAVLATEIRARANQLLAAESVDGPMRTMLEAFRKNLIHDLDDDGFADMFAQTICYGMLAARISRPGAMLVADNMADMVPKTNPFLKELFENFLKLGGRDKRKGMDFDELGAREVVDMLNRANMEAVLRDFGDRNPKEDPVIHFYELFLKEYDPKKRIQRGVFYTPRPVVNFIVRGADEILRTEFGLPLGLADTTTWRDLAAKNERVTIPDHVDPNSAFVQILDPATGTGTFLVEVIDLVHSRMVEHWEGEGLSRAEIAEAWNAYVPKHLLPRLTAFELMMAPYSIAHMKVGLKLTETGYKFGSNERAHIFLTNALEPACDLDMEFIFMTEALAHEAQAANDAKANTAFTVVIGNPPYGPSNESLNPTKSKNGEPNWIGRLLEDYFVYDGVRLHEKNPKSIKADENKFIRLAQFYISRSALGVFSFINPHGYLDAVVSKGMRQNLRTAFNRSWILNLHGNANRGLMEGDENVFDIKQGVAINTFARCSDAASVIMLDDLRGKREGSKHAKYESLLSSDLTALVSHRIIPKNFDEGFGAADISDDGYQGLFGLASVMPQFENGFKSHRDHFAWADTHEEFELRIGDFFGGILSDEELRKKYDLTDSPDWEVSRSRDRLRALSERDSKRVCVFPFDFQWSLVDQAIMNRPRSTLLLDAYNGPSLITSRQTKDAWDIKVVNLPINHKALAKYDTNYLFPLWLKPSPGETHCRPNIDRKLAVALGQGIDLTYEDGVTKGQRQFGADYRNEKGEQTSLLGTVCDGRGDLTKTFGPRDLFDWIYAVLHSPGYRVRYAEFLKSDFPRIPPPKDRAIFGALIRIGRELVALHLLAQEEAPVLRDPDIRFAGHGEARVERGFPKYENGKVMINGSCWFEDVQRETWEFHVGGYQVCEKWLKDRAAKGGKNPSPGRVLTDEDTLHYRRVVVALTETRRLMAEIDRIIAEHGGWPGAVHLPPPPPPTIEQIIQADEGQDLEYKSTLQFDVKEGGKSKLVRKATLKTIVAFLNSGHGLLVIGISDDKRVVGLEQDFSTMTPERRSREWFQQTLVNLINEQIGSEFAPSYSIRFATHEGKLVCIVDVKERGPKPAYLKDNETREFYVRTSNVTKQLKGEEIANYINTHWK